jgi:superfamily II RNA helicase
MAAKKLSITGLTEATLTKLAQDLQRQLESNPIYRELVLVRKALAEIKSTSSSGKNNTTEQIVSYTRVPKRLGRVTAVSAACEALKEAGRPMSIHELLEALPRHGFQAGRKRPASRLSSYLSKAGERSPLRSIYLNNKPMWWFRDQRLPDTED